MKHAEPVTPDSLEDVLSVLRMRAELTERKLGTFYRKSSAFLHFHEDPAGLFTDVGGKFERLPVSTPKERRALLGRVDDALGIVGA